MNIKVPGYIYILMLSAICLPVSYGMVFENVVVVVLAAVLGAVLGYSGMRASKSIWAKTLGGVPTALNAIIVIYLIMGMSLYLWDTTLNKQL